MKKEMQIDTSDEALEAALRKWLVKTLSNSKSPSAQQAQAANGIIKILGKKMGEDDKDDHFFGR